MVQQAALPISGSEDEAYFNDDHAPTRPEKTGQRHNRIADFRAFLTADQGNCLQRQWVRHPSSSIETTMRNLPEYGKMTANGKPAAFNRARCD